MVGISTKQIDIDNGVAAMQIWYTTWDTNNISRSRDRDKKEYCFELEGYGKIAEISPAIRIFGRTVWDITAKIVPEFKGSIEDTIGALIQYQKEWDTMTISRPETRTYARKEADVIIKALLNYPC